MARRQHKNVSWLAGTRQTARGKCAIFPSSCPPTWTEGNVKWKLVVCPATYRNRTNALALCGEHMFLGWNYLHSTMGLFICYKFNTALHFIWCEYANSHMVNLESCTHNNAESDSVWKQKLISRDLFSNILVKVKKWLNPTIKNTEKCKSRLCNLQRTRGAQIAYFQ